MASELSNKVNNIDLQINLEDDVVDPWNVVSKSDTGIDYDKLISMALINEPKLQFNDI